MNTKVKTYYNKGFEFFKNNLPYKAIKNYKKALEYDPEFIEAYINLGAAYQKAGEVDNAISAYKKAIKLEPKLTISYYNLASLYQDTDPALCARYYEKVLKIDPKDWDATNRLGLIYKKLGRYDEAISCFQKAIRLFPEFENAHFNLGVITSLIGITSKSDSFIKKSAKHFKTVLKINPNSAEAISNYALVLQNQDKNKLAETYYKKAIRLNPRLPQVYYNLGSLYEKIGKIAYTAKYYKKALEIDPLFPETLGSYAFIQKQMCNWDEYKKYETNLDQETLKAVRLGYKPSESPFFNAVRKNDPEINAQVARVWTKYWVDRYKKLNPPRFFDYKKNISNFKKSGKIRIAYASEGFRDFPTTHNITGVFERHNKSVFELYLYSYGPDDRSKFRKNLIEIADVFRDVKHLSLPEMANLVYQDNIDIFIDLKGHTRGSRFEFLWSRPSPIQIDWLGFVGTTQAEFIDYFIADRVVLPPKAAKFFSEKIIYMPDSYWPTNDHLRISISNFTRKNFNLPEKAVVLASFNQPYKIEPEIFDVWMNILKKVPNSVLWQWSDHKIVDKNITKEVKKRGVNTKKIIFARELPKEEHLARLKLADLALDTTICNGHTTTTDCLWVGVPVITSQGNHFASRVSESILNAIGLPELVAKDLNEYENLAVSLARDKNRLLTCKHKLSSNIKTHPLFNTKKLTNNLEKAYKTIWQNFISGKPPKNVYF